jgi:hypothetical protein
MTTMSKSDDEHLARAALLAERIYHEAHRIAAKGGADPIEVSGLTIAMAALWGKTEVEGDGAWPSEPTVLAPQ